MKIIIIDLLINNKINSLTISWISNKIHIYTIVFFSSCTRSWEITVDFERWYFVSALESIFVYICDKDSKYYQDLLDFIHCISWLTKHLQPLNCSYKDCGMIRIHLQIIIIKASNIYRLLPCCCISFLQ